MSSILSRVKGLSKIRVNGKTIDLSEELGIDADAMEEEFSDHQDKVIFWNRLKNRALRSLRVTEENVRVQESNRFIAYWDAFKEASREFSDGLVWAHVKTDVSVMAKRKEVRKAKLRYEDLRDICVAFEHRKSSLINVGKMQRDETL